MQEILSCQLLGLCRRSHGRVIFREAGHRRSMRQDMARVKDPPMVEPWWRDFVACSRRARAPGKHIRHRSNPRCTIDKAQARAIATPGFPPIPAQTIATKTLLPTTHTTPQPYPPLHLQLTGPLSHQPTRPNRQNVHSLQPPTNHRGPSGHHANRRNRAHRPLQVRRLRHGRTAEARRAYPMQELRSSCALQAEDEPVSEISL
jgi:hypothetical protein